MAPKKAFLPLFVILLALAGAIAWFVSQDHPRLPIDALPISFKTANSTYTISVEVPQTGNTSLDRKLSLHVAARIQEFSQMYAPENFSPADMDMLGFNEGRTYDLVITSEPWTYGNLAGVIIEEYQYTGGAHGGVSLWPFMVDAEGEELSLPDLFLTDDYLKNIADVVRPRLKKQLEEAGAYNEEMFFVGTEASYGNYLNVLLSDEGITFRFNQYQVAPYVAGMPEVTVPWSEFKGILSNTHFDIIPK